MAWRAANCLLQLQNDVNAKYPKNRSKELDAFKGDAAHEARESDHNPNSAGVVCAYDITHDPAHGVDTYALFDYMIRHPDPRVQYLISNKRIWNTDKDKPGKYRAYTGTNPHQTHLHVSVKQNATLYNNPTSWDIGPPVAGPTPILTYPDTLRRGSVGEDVEVLQFLLGTPSDGMFGPDTEAVVRAYQQVKGIGIDGICGPETWRKLRADISPGVVEPPPTEFDHSGKGSWYSWYEGHSSWKDTGDAPNSNALGVPDHCQGVAFYDRSTLGKWFVVEAPNGKQALLQQTDIGPHPTTGRLIDISAVAADMGFGYTPGNFPTDSIFRWKASAPPPEIAGLPPKEQATKYASIRGW